MKQFRLNIEAKNNKYPIIVGSGLSNNLLKIIQKNSISFNKCLFVIDSKIQKKTIKKIIRNFKKKKELFTFLMQMRKIKTNRV